MKDTSDRAGGGSSSVKTSSPPAAMPRFYDSDTEEGAGSLGTSCVCWKLDVDWVIVLKY